VNRWRIATKKLIIDLANLHDEGIPRFRRTYERSFPGLAEEELLTKRDELRLLWQKVNRLDPLVIPARTGKLWNKHRVYGSHTPLPAYILEDWIRLDRGNGWRVRWDDKVKRIYPHTGSLRAILVMACLEHGDRMRYCQNEDCVAPYFISRRKDQKFCSNECAAPSHRESKRRWWTENRSVTK
jgi:hypothetical protein